MRAPAGTTAVPPSAIGRQPGDVLGDTCFPPRVGRGACPVVGPPPAPSCCYRYFSHALQTCQRKALVLSAISSCSAVERCTRGTCSFWIRAMRGRGLRVDVRDDV